MAGKTIEKVSKVAKWGNSLGFRIPQEGVERLGLKEGATVNVTVKEDTITIRRAKPRRKWTEEEVAQRRYSFDVRPRPDPRPRRARNPVSKQTYHPSAAVLFT